MNETEKNYQTSLEKIEEIARAIKPLGYTVIGFADLLENPIDNRIRGLEIRLAGPCFQK
jgi:hypothetical protein